MTTAVESDSSLPPTCKSATDEVGDILHCAVCVYQDIDARVCVAVDMFLYGNMALYETNYVHVLQNVLSVTVEAAATVSADGSYVCLA